jgi:protein phosphatase
MTRATRAFAWRTDKGRVRKRNEDAVRVEPEDGLVVVADGMGGARGGDIASQLTTDIIGRRLQEDALSLADPTGAQGLIVAAIEEANRAVFERSRRAPELAGMGTTVVVGHVGADWLAYGHVGDSRLYRLRSGVLQQLTRDHSYIQDVVDQGLFPSRSAARDFGINEHMLSRAVGTAADVSASTDLSDLVPGDLFLFCTDGLSGMLSDEALREVLTGVETDLDTIADQLVQRALDKGGLDNITLVLLRIDAVD